MVSAQLTCHKQQPNESVDEFAQDLEKLFEHSYGHRKGMDESSKEMLKRVFCARFVVEMAGKSDTITQDLPCAAEQQEKQLSSLHRSGSATKLNSNAKPMASARTQKTSVTFQSEKYSRILYTRRVKCPAYAMSAVDLVTIGVTAQNASHLARLQEGTEQDNEHQFSSLSHPFTRDIGRSLPKTKAGVG